VAHTDNKVGVIFDRTHSVALLDAIKAPSNRLPTLSTVTEEALLCLLIFETAEILQSATRDREEAREKLKSEGLIELIPSGTFKKPMLLVDSYTKNLASYLIAARFGGDSSEFSQTIIAQRRSFDFYRPLIRPNSPSLANLDDDEVHEAIVDYCDRHMSSDLLDKTFGMHPSILQYGLPDERDFYLGEIQDGPAPSSIIAAQFLLSYIEYRGLARRAASSGLPLKSKCEMTATPIDKTLGPEAMQLFKFHLDEVRIIPRLDSIEDVLRLRGHKYVENFRTSILEWLERIATGEPEIEHKYHQSMRTANEELKNLNKWRYVDSPFTLAASLAVGLAEMLFTGTSWSLAFTGISYASTIDRLKKERAFGYALFPR
jgi:hypothetical protein